MNQDFLICHNLLKLSLVLLLPLPYQKGFSVAGNVVSKNRTCLNPDIILLLNKNLKVFFIVILVVLTFTYLKKIEIFRKF